MIGRWERGGIPAANGRSEEILNQLASILGLSLDALHESIANERVNSPPSRPGRSLFRAGKCRNGGHLITSLNDVYTKVVDGRTINTCRVCVDEKARQMALERLQKAATKPPREPTQMFNCRLGVDSFAWLETESRRTGISKSDIVRDLIIRERAEKDDLYPDIEARKVHEQTISNLQGSLLWSSQTIETQKRDLQELQTTLLCQSEMLERLMTDVCAGLALLAETRAQIQALEGPLLEATSQPVLAEYAIDFDGLRPVGP